jgi:hypothetical protein
MGADKHGAGSFAVEGLRLGALNGGDAAGEIEGGGDAGGLGQADAAEARDVADVAAAEIGDPFAQQLAGELDGVLAARAGAEKDGQELGIGEGCRAVLEEPFAGAVVARKIGDQVSHR